MPFFIQLQWRWIQIQGYILPNGTLVQKKTLEAFHKDINVGTFKPTEPATAEFTPTWKLTDHHLSCYGSARQRVYLATELISNSVSKALPLWDKEQKEFSDFLALFNEVQSSKCFNWLFSQSAYIF